MENVRGTQGMTKEERRRLKKIWIERPAKMVVSKNKSPYISYFN